MRTAIFDLDGTLADTSRDLIGAVNACFRARGAGEPLCPEGDAMAAFTGGRVMLRLGFERLHGAADEALVEEAYPEFLARYEARIDRETTLYPGVEAALERLAEGGWRLGVCTNKPERLAEILLRRLGLRDRFASLVGADTLPVRKPDPAPLMEAIARAGGDAERAVLIGDTVTDRACAENAGVPCVLVTFGPEGEGVARLAPEALLGDYAALGETLESLIGAG